MLNRALAPLSLSLVLAPVLVLGACGPAGNDPGPGGVTVDEAKALDDAAEMLDQQRLPDEEQNDLAEQETEE